MAYSVFRVPNGVTVSPTGIAQVVSIIQAYSGGGQTADLGQWQNSAGSVLARIDSVGNFSGVAISGTTANFSSNLTVLGNTILGDNSGDTVTVSGTPTFIQNTTFSGDIAVNGGDITTTSSTFNFIPSTITSNILNISTGSNTSGVVNIATNTTSGTITLGTSTTNTIVQGNLIVNGTTTTVNSTTINIDDLNLNLASDSGTAATVDGGGITVGSGLGITMNYDHANTSWTSSQNFNIATTKTYKIAGTDVLNATGIAAGVILSSLQKVGTIATGVWNGTVIGTGYTTAQVTAVTAGATNTISVTGTTQAPFINLATVGTPVTSSFVKITTDVYGRVSATTAVASGDIPNHSAAQITVGTLAVAQGGTNLASYGTGVLLQASGTTISQISPTTSGYFLRTNGANTFSTYSALTSGDVTTALGYTPISTSNGITGAGTSGRLTVWNGTNSVTSDAELLYDSTNNILSIGCLNLTAATGDATIGTAVTVLDTWSASTYRSAKYIIQTKASGGSAFQVSEALVITDGATNAYLTEYGQIYTGASPLIALSADVSGGNVRLLVAGAAASNSVRFVKTMITN